MASTSRRLPGLWQGVRWAWARGNEGGGIGRARLTRRALAATLAHRSALQRWMSVVHELASRGLVRDVQGEYLRAIRPHVNMHTGVADRAVQLIDHVDWMETAFHSWALERFAGDEPLVLAELTPPRGYEFMRLQLQRTPVQAPEGELLLVLALRRAANVQHKAQPVEAAALGFSRFRIEGTGCLVIGGVRGQRDPLNRLSQAELNNVLVGWKPSVLLVRVMQELARYWGQKLVGLDPAAHRLHHWTYRLDERRRETGQKIFAAYDALWKHFDAQPGPEGWVVLPAHSDEKLAATDLSPERRERQVRRADYWIRTRKLLHAQMKSLLQRPGREITRGGVTEELDSVTQSPDGTSSYFDADYLDSSEDDVPSRVLQTGPGALL
ncbi:DUF535 family protein [Ramlibacter albus]|uniref:DUF535 family protein n=1 Tax=Ramlibacter albus TaxID=2079448 RepID=A0A923S1C9_9BURK|nr:DUF535 family protein [Ramlibacter albus]MBC5763538.1 DUF535 family protein [Ramlibacter albus]